MINAQMMPSMLPMAGGFTYEEVQSLPPMTGPSSPPGHAITWSSEFNNTTLAAWRAFDQVVGSTNRWASNSGEGAPQWVVRTVPSPIMVWKYRISYFSGSTNDAPRDFRLQGWNGSSWQDLDVRVNETGWSSPETREFIITEAPDAYASYRLYIDAFTGGNLVVIAELELLQAFE